MAKPHILAGYLRSQALVKSAVVVQLHTGLQQRLSVNESINDHRLGTQLDTFPPPPSGALKLFVFQDLRRAMLTLHGNS